MTPRAWYPGGFFQNGSITYSDVHDFLRLTLVDHVSRYMIFSHVHTAFDKYKFAINPNVRICSIPLPSRNIKAREPEFDIDLERDEGGDVMSRLSGMDGGKVMWEMRWLTDWGIIR